VTGEGGTAADVSPAEVAERLRALLDAVDAGELVASDTQRAYLAGAVDTLDRLSGG